MNNMDKLILLGVDNDGKPRQDYAQKLAGLTIEQLSRETESKIWLSCYANNNPRSDWQCDATYKEWDRRGDVQGYARAYDKVAAR